MSAPLTDSLRSALAVVAERHGLGLLVLHGSRARGEERASSDWDFAYAGGARVDRLALLADLSATLGTDAVDVADFDRAGGLLRFRVARDGVLIAEDRAGAWQEARLRATAFWCDAEPVLRRAYEERLARIGRTES